MCFGGGSKTSSQKTPPTTFGYAPQSSGPSQQQQAAMGTSTMGSTFGSELGSGGMQDRAKTKQGMY